MRRAVTSPGLLAALLLALSLGGCSFAGLAGFGADKAAPPAPPPKTCDVDAHCDQSRGEVCRKADGSGAPLQNGSSTRSFDGICVIPAAQSAREVFLEITPLAGSDVPVVQMGPVSLAEGQNQSLSVPEPVVVAGEVAYAQTGTGGRQQLVEHARVRFKQPSPIIKRRPLVFEVETGSDESAGQFRRQLPQGSYWVSVTPPDRGEVHAPPERPLGSQELSVAPSLLSQPPLHLEVTDPSNLLVFQGQVTFPRGDAKVPAAGIEVYAFDESGRPGINPTAPSPPRLLAQPAKTDDDGAFTLWLPKTSEDDGVLRMRLQFGPAPGGAPFPTVKGDHYDIDRSTRLSAPIVLPRIEAPVTTSGAVFSPQGQPLAGAQVTLHTVSRFELTNFSYLATAVTDRDGHYSLAVFPGIYQAVAEPAPDPARSTPLGLCPLEGEVRVERPGEAGPLLLCKERRFLFGQVKSPAFQPVAGVVVEAVRRPDGVLADERRDQAVSGADGSFSLALSPGTYDVTLQPGPDLKLPFKTLAGIVVADDSPESLLVVELDPPFELFGQLQAAGSNAPVAGTIEAYAVDQTSTTLVGRGLSQKDGRYSIVLPGVSQ